MWQSARFFINYRLLGGVTDPDSASGASIAAGIRVEEKM
jgi:hypothetical protein